MKNKKTGRYMAAFAVIVMALMIGATAVNAVSVKLIDENDDNDLMQTLGTDKEIVKYGWTGKERADDESWEWHLWDDSPSGEGAHDDRYDDWPAWDYIYYKFSFDEWEETHQFSNVEIGVYFAADGFPFANDGPDLKVTSDDNGNSKYGDDYSCIKKSMGLPSTLRWKWYSEDKNEKELNEYVNSDGEIFICILNAAGGHAKVEEVGVKWTIDNYIPSCSISGPSTVERGAPATFTSNTDDPDGDDITEYKWKVDGTEVDTSEDLTYTFTSSGEHVVSLTVKDENGGWSNPATKTVTVNENKNPTMKSISPNSGKRRTDITFTFKAEDVNNDRVKFSIDWGDDDTQTTSYFDNNDGEVTGTAVHEYMLEDTYTLRVKAIDEKGGESSWKTISFTSPRSRPAVSSALLSFLELNSPALARLIYNLVYALS